MGGQPGVSAHPRAKLRAGQCGGHGPQAQVPGSSASITAVQMGKRDARGSSKDGAPQGPWGGPCTHAMCAEGSARLVRADLCVPSGRAVPTYRQVTGTSLSLTSMGPVCPMGPKPSVGRSSGQGPVGQYSRCPGTRGHLRSPFWNMSSGQCGGPTGLGHQSFPVADQPPTFSLVSPLRLGYFWGRSTSGADSGNFLGWDPGTKIFSKSRKTLAAGWGFPSGSKVLTAMPDPGLVWTFKGTRSCPEWSAPRPAALCLSVQVREGLGCRVDTTRR